MAGVGFSLRKLHRDDGYTGLFKLYGAAGLISSGPWLLSIMTLLLIGMLGRALVPGGQLGLIAWRRLADNPCFAIAEKIALKHLPPPGEQAQTCGPGPFSMANADTVSEQLAIAGFEGISLRRCDLPLKIGHDLDHAVEFNMALGPAGEVLRLWEDRIDEIRPKIARELRETLAEFDGPDGKANWTKPLCAYPYYPRYMGAGDTKAAASYHCVVSRPDNLG